MIEIEKYFLYNFRRTTTMNLYVRYFDSDTVALSVEEAIAFLSAIPEIEVTPELIEDIKSYANSNMPYPKRYKVRPRVYFIIIKTTAQTLEEFKAGGRSASATNDNNENSITKKESKANRLLEDCLGWYKGSILFKRVVQIPGTGKFQYQDTRFSALVKATNAQNCYDRIIDHLKNRQDVDLRSQFPSARGNNFQFEYIGETLPAKEK